MKTVLSLVVILVAVGSSFAQADQCGKVLPKTIVCNGQQVDFDPAEQYYSPLQSGEGITLNMTIQNGITTLKMTKSGAVTTGSSSEVFKKGCDSTCEIRFFPNKSFNLYLRNADKDQNYRTHQSIEDAFAGKSAVKMYGFLELTQPKNAGSGILSSDGETKSQYFGMDCTGDFSPGESRSCDELFPD